MFAALLAGVALVACIAWLASHRAASAARADAEGITPDIPEATAAPPLTTMAATPSAPAPATRPAASAAPLPAAPAARPPAAPSRPELLRLDFPSPALGRQMNTFIYLPLGYRSSGQRYPVLYLLHGSGGSDTEWPGYGLTLAADDLIATGQIRPLLIVMPQGDQDYWLNHADNGPRWADYVWQDLVGYVDATYRTLPDPTKRAIGGLSMGGYGALNLAIQHPDVFRVVGAHSPVLPVDDGNLKEFFGDSAYFRQWDPFVLYRDAATASRLRLWIDVSTGDPRLQRTSDFHQLLASEGIPHEWHALPGNHDGFYWGAHAKDYLRFYDGALWGK